MAKLFNSFIQADISTTRKYGGAGLALIISNKLVDAMDGEIQVKSQLGAGTTLTIRLTLERQDSINKEGVREQFDLTNAPVLLLITNKPVG